MKRAVGPVVAGAVVAWLAAACPALAAGPALAQGATAICGATVIVSPGREIEGATLLVRDGRVEAVGKDLAIPPDARRLDLPGRTIWPGFIDAAVDVERLDGKVETPHAKDAAPGAPATPPPLPASSGRSLAGNALTTVHPEVRAADQLAPDAATVDAFRAAGFTTVLAEPAHGILKGSGVVVDLGDGPVGTLVVAESPDVAASFETGGEDSEQYPNSVMGATAVIRQALLDARWLQEATAWAGAHPRAPRPQEDVSLEALGRLVAPHGGARLAFTCHDVLDVLRAGEIAHEAGVGLRVRGGGDEYRLLPQVVALKIPIVLSVDFPAPPRAVTEDEWQDVPLAQLRHWDLAPDDARFLEAAGGDVSLSAHGLADVKDFPERVRRMIERGLAERSALAMCTTRPAGLLGLGATVGTLEPGKLANFVVARGRPFAKGTEVRETWVDGVRHVESRDPEGPLGAFDATLHRAATTVAGRLTLSASGGAFKWTPPAAPGSPAPGGDASAKPKSADVSRVVVAGDEVRFRLEGSPFELDAPVDFKAVLKDSALSGGSLDSAVTLTAARTFAPEPPHEPRKPEPTRTVPPRPGPLTKTADFLVHGARVWTSAAAGILPSADVLVRGGKIAAVGPDLKAPPGVTVVEAQGRDLTPGLIDCHSHSAIVGGVNEGTNSCTAEVRIGDVLNSETGDIYRLLAGGLTSAHELHGSANTMGGQCQLIKLRWGSPPEALKFAGCAPTIKFALGENVKQSNWGEKFVTRYPQTRVGVEEFLRERFAAAASYRDRRRAWEKGQGRETSLPPRRDLQLDTLVEILEGKRLIHCHSYRQDEILDLMRVAEDFGFKVGTFQHVLEGYKVADELAKHGAGASTFTDWWAYKFEVYDAIPYNAALMHDRGVNVSLNSDSTELARRLQLEAAKAVKWGGVPEADALDMVTINPARQTGVDRMTGSIEVGKDADLVLWSGSPLSTASRALDTWVDGLLYFDRDQDLAARPRLAAERAELTSRARDAAADDELKAGSTWAPSYLQAAEDCLGNVAGGRLAEDAP